MALDDASALETIRRRTLLREGSWCIVDVVESDGTIRRLPVTHPDPAKQQAAQRLAERWFPEVPDPAVAKTRPSPNVLARAEHGLGCLIVVPLVARAKVLGRITFVAEDGDASFSPADVALASDLADLCALALDNARQYRQAIELSESAKVDSHAKSTFLGNVSHELMTPLNAIGGYVSLRRRAGRTSGRRSPSHFRWRLAGELAVSARSTPSFTHSCDGLAMACVLDWRLREQSGPIGQS